MTGAVKGNRIALGLTDGTSNLGSYIENFGSVNKNITGSLSAYGTSIGTGNNAVYTTVDKSLGITLDATKSGIIVERNNSKYLNFYIN